MPIRPLNLTIFHSSDNIKKPDVFKPVEANSHRVKHQAVETGLKATLPVTAGIGLNTEAAQKDGKDERDEGKIALSPVVEGRESSESLRSEKTD